MHTWLGPALAQFLTRPEVPSRWHRAGRAL